MEEGIGHVISQDVPFAGLNVEGHHDEIDFVAEQAVANMAVKRKDSGVIILRNFGALLEIDWEKGEPMVDIP